MDYSGPVIRGPVTRGPVTQGTVTLSLAAYLVAATLGGWLHVHSHEGECQHVHSKHAQGEHSHAGHAHHEHHHPGLAHHHHDQGDHTPSKSPVKAPRSPLHDDHCAACKFAAEQVLPVSLVALVETSELCQELIPLSPPTPRGTSLEHAQARAPPQAG